LSVGYQGSVVAGMSAIPFSKRPAIRLTVWTKKMVAKLNRLLKTLGGYNSAQVNILCFVSWALLVCELSMLHIHMSFYICYIIKLHNCISYHTFNEAIQMHVITRVAHSRQG
jgi:hypothetical protein